MGVIVRKRVLLSFLRFFIWGFRIVGKREVLSCGLKDGGVF